jgi:D-threo-aldose 1-dehydrogenase
MATLTARQPLGRTGLALPPIVFGTSCLGNLYQALPWETKLATVREFFRHVAPPVVLDSAGKYGAGLALEVIGRCLRELKLPAEQVLVSNKLAWKRVPLRGLEPTFEPGVWADLKHDAVQVISYEGILECWRQGIDLLGGVRPAIVSVHDPDEYLSGATHPRDRERRLQDIVEAYRALNELKSRGEVAAVGVGAKSWTVIRELAERAELDWVMFACSLTVMTHPPELLAFMDRLHRRGVGMINSAVFHAGFLTGGSFFDYRKVDPAVAADAPLFAWRTAFGALCLRFGVRPADVCVRFGMAVPGVLATALNTSKPERVADNVAAVTAEIPAALWTALKDAGLVAREFPYLG